jgi:hypothetical protein
MKDHRNSFLYGITVHLGFIASVITIITFVTDIRTSSQLYNVLSILFRDSTPYAVGILKFVGIIAGLLLFPGIPALCALYWTERSGLDLKNPKLSQFIYFGIYYFFMVLFILTIWFAGRWQA